MRESIDHFIKRHVIIFNLLVIFISMPVIWLIVTPLCAALSEEWRRAVEYGSSALVIGIFLWIGSGKVLFSWKCPKFFKNLFSFGLLGFIGAVGAFVFSRGPIEVRPTFYKVMGCLLMNFAIALSEEMIFRGVVLHSMLNAWAEKKQVVMMAVVGSSILFGLRHLFNLWMSPGTTIMTGAQVIFTFMAGIYLCAVYLRTNNIWVCITIHFLEDFGTAFWGLFSSQSLLIGDITMGPAAGMIAMQIPYVIFAVLMLRDKNWTYDREDHGKKASAATFVDVQ